MKILLLAVLLAPGYLLAQDSVAVECRLVKETDPYTKETKLSSGFLTLQGAKLTIDADSKEIDFFFAIPDKCFSDASTVFLFFEGSKTRTTYRNTGSMNCEGNFHFTFRNTPLPNTVLKKLATQKVANMIFTDNDKKTITVSLLPAQQQALMEAAHCIIEQGNTLIK